MAPPFVAVPEEAWRRRHKLSSGEWDLYVAYIAHRNRLTGRCDPSVTALANEMELTPNYVSDLKRGLISKGWIRRLGRSAVALLVGEFPGPKVVEIGGANLGKISDSTSEKSGVRGANLGKISDSITDFSGAHNKDEPEAVEPEAAAASATASRDPFSEPVDDKFVADVIEAGIYPAELVRFVLKKLRLHCKQLGAAPVKRQFLKWLSTERPAAQPLLPTMGADVEEIPARAGPRPPRPCGPNCALCFGTGMYYPEGYDKGVARCPGQPVERETDKDATEGGRLKAVNGGEFSGGN